MDVLAFDGRTGAAGDMILGALIGAGADPDVLGPIEGAIDVTYSIGETNKNGICATRVRVSIDGEVPDDESDGTPTRRSYDEVVSIVEEMAIPTQVRADARAVFRVLGEAEASVHGTELGGTHFHEVGADDAIADVVGAMALVHDLAPDRVLTTPLAVGGGETSMGHGRYPVPSPAVVEIAERADWSIQGGPVSHELLTPTGAAILAHVASGTETIPPIRLRGAGYGAGARDFESFPNVLRALVGDAREPDETSSPHAGRVGDSWGNELDREHVRVLETNVDDVSPEVLGGLQEALPAVGARDVSFVPLSMKKSRPGHLIRVIVRPEDAPRVARRLAEETGTLGIRETVGTHRWVADREIRTVTVEMGDESYDVDVKVATDESGVVYDVSPEYDDSAIVAREAGVPVREVMRLAEAAGWE